MEKNKKHDENYFEGKHILIKKKHIINIKKVENGRVSTSDIEAESLENAKEFLNSYKKDDINFVVFDSQERIILSGEIKKGKVKYTHEDNGNHYGQYKDKDKGKDKDKDKDKDDDDSYA